MHYGSSPSTGEPCLLGALLGAAVIAACVTGVLAIIMGLFILSPVDAMIGFGMNKIGNLLWTVVFLIAGFVAAAMVMVWAARRFTAWHQSGWAWGGVGAGAVCAIVVAAMILLAP